MCLNYSQATLLPHPAWFKEKSPFMKMVPGAKKGGDCCSRYFYFLNLQVKSIYCLEVVFLIVNAYHRFAAVILT